MSIDVAIVGPTKAGKTVYLACLLRAALGPRAAERPIKVRPDPQNRAAMGLQKSAVEVIRGGAPPATSEITRFEVWADLPGSVFGGLGKESMKLTLVDTPGGDCMPAAGDAVAVEVAKSVGEADALLVVVPADRQVRPTDMDDRMVHLVREASGYRSSSTRRLPFLRVAVVMTMSELLVHRKGSGALRCLDSLDARSEIGRACGGQFLRVVSSLAPAGGDWYSLVSAFGFDPDTGEVPVERTPSGWRLRQDGAAFRDQWWPYRVFEPLEFLARGACWREDL